MTVADQSTISVFDLGAGGVHVDADPLLLNDHDVTVAQNMTHDATAMAGGAIRVRPGLAKFNLLTAGGPILGGIGMAVVGFAGAPPILGPPPTPGSPDTSPTGNPSGAPGPGPGGGTNPPGGLGTGGGNLFTPTRIFNGTRLVVIGRGDSTEGSNVYGNSWFVGDKKFADVASVIFTGTSGFGANQTTAGPPGGSQCNVFGPSSSGQPLVAIANGNYYYPSPTGVTAVSPILPVLRKLTPDGLSDKAVLTIPDNPLVLAISPVPAHLLSINALVTEYGNGDALYCAVYDDVTNGAQAGFYGRVLRISGLDSGSYVCAEVFNSLNTNANAAFNGTAAQPTVPIALENYLGHLWIGIYRGATGYANGPSFAELRPDPTQPDGWGIAFPLIDSDVSAADVSCMKMYNGILYVGYVHRGGAVTSARIYSYAGVPGAVTLQVTASGSVAADANGFVSMAVFNGNLYASYYNAGTIAQIYQYDGTSWTIVWTSGVTIHPLILTVDDGVLYACGTFSGLSQRALFLWTTDAVTWTDATTKFPFTATAFPVPILCGIAQT